MKFRLSFLTKAFFLVSFFLISTSVFSQRIQQNSNFWSNVRFGGGIGLGFGNNYFSGTLAPSAIYEFNQYFAMGVGLNGSYVKDHDYKATILGGSLLTLFNPVPSIQLSAEFEELHVNRKLELDGANNISDNYWNPALFLGAGYNTGNVVIGVRYDVLFDENKSVYTDAFMPFVRVYF